MALILPYALPREIERGVETTLRVEVYDSDDSSVQTIQSGSSIEIRQGDTTIVDEPASFVGASAGYVLTAAATADLSLSDDLLEIWTLVIGGTTYTYYRPAYLVRNAFQSVITDTDLTNLHADIDDLNSEADFSPYRDEAENAIRAKLISMGRRPHLIFDAWALRNLHIYESLHRVFTDWSSSAGTGRYQELAAHYRQRADEEWQSITWRYDEGEDGGIDEEDVQSASPVLYTSAPKPLRWYP